MRALCLALGGLPLCSAALLGCGGRARSAPEPAAAAAVAGASGGGVDAGGAGGAASLERAGASSDSDAGAAGAPDVEDCSKFGAGGEVGSDIASPRSVAPRALSAARVNAPWASQTMVGMAVDPAGRVYLASPDGIEQIDGAALSTYLTLQEARSQADLNGGIGFRALDLDDAGALYSILSSTVISSTQPHQAAIWRSQPSLSVQLGVVGSNDVALISMQSMWRVTPHCEHRLFTNGELLGLDCGGAQLSVARSGTFLYLADCGVNQLYRGNADGSALGVLYSTATPEEGPFSAGQFLCSTRDPAGGFYVVSNNGIEWQLFHLTETAHDDIGLARIDISPSLADARAKQLGEGDPHAFERCKLAAKADGTVYMHTSSTLWQLTPSL